MSSYRYLFAFCLTMLVVGCAELKLPSEREMEAVFITAETGAELLASNVPDSIPVMAVAELRDWSPICDECHIGPHYSSHTILAWGHLDSCVEDTACASCHDQRLHQTGLRGNKEACYECHLDREQPVTCTTCHTSACQADDVKHTSAFVRTHGKETDWMGIACDTCHGGERWCRECHGMPMPHPENIQAVHPDLVQGQAENCMKCHGRQSCTNCHLVNDVDVRLTLN
jgi:hypothetical protein